MLRLRSISDKDALNCLAFNEEINTYVVPAESNSLYELVAMEVIVMKDDISSERYNLYNEVIAVELIRRDVRNSVHLCNSLYHNNRVIDEIVGVKGEKYANFCKVMMSIYERSIYLPTIARLREIHLRAYSRYSFNTYYTPNELLVDEELCIEILKAAPIYPYMRRSSIFLSSDRISVTIKAIQLFPGNYMLLSDDMKQNREVTLIAVRCHPPNYKRIPNNLRGDIEIAIAAISRDEDLYEYVDEYLRVSGCLDDYIGISSTDNNCAMNRLEMKIRYAKNLSLDASPKVSVDISRIMLNVFHGDVDMINLMLSIHGSEVKCNELISGKLSNGIVLLRDYQRTLLRQRTQVKRAR